MRKAETAGASFMITHDAREGVEGAHVIYSDAFYSMGQEEEAIKRRKDFAPFQITTDLLAGADQEHIVLHCLPAHRGEEITDEVMDGPALGRVRRGREPDARPACDPGHAHQVGGGHHGEDGRGTFRAGLRPWLAEGAALLALSGPGSACAVVEPPPGGPVDMTPPHLVFMIPDSAATGLGDVTSINLTFSEKMDRTSAVTWLHFFPDQRIRKTKWTGATEAEIEFCEPLPADTVIVVEICPGCDDAHKVKSGHDQPAFPHRDGRLSAGRPHPRRPDHGRLGGHQGSRRAL